MWKKKKKSKNSIERGKLDMDQQKGMVKKAFTIETFNI